MAASNDNQNTASKENKISHAESGNQNTPSKENEASLVEADDEAETAYLLANFGPGDYDPRDLLAFPEYCDWLAN